MTGRRALEALRSTRLEGSGIMLWSQPATPVLAVSSRLELPLVHLLSTVNVTQELLLLLLLLLIQVSLTLRLAYIPENQIV